MVTLSADGDLTSTNSFVSLDFAEDYFSQRLYVDKWTSASSEDKGKALMWASSLLSRSYSWKGSIVTNGQLLAFPRKGLYLNGYPVSSSAIPIAIKHATCSLALTLLSKNVTTTTVQNDNVSELKLGPLGLKFNKSAEVVVTSDSNGVPLSIVSMFSDYVEQSSALGNFQVRLIRT